MMNASKTVASNSKKNNIKNREKEFQVSVKSVSNRPVTFEDVKLLNPTDDQMSHIIKIFPNVASVDYEMIKTSVYDHIKIQAELLRPTHVISNYRGEESVASLQIFLNRLVNNYVLMAHASAVFYDKKRQEAIEATKSYNHDRDEDRLGVDGQANRAFKAREYAAQTACSSFASMALAEGAVAAYKEILGSEWIPYNKDQLSSNQLDRDIAKAQCNALGF